MITISIGVLITIIMGVVGLLGGITVVLTKALVKSALNSYQQQLVSSKETFLSSLNNLKEVRDDCEERCQEASKSLEKKHEGMRDRWESFLEKYTILDATRGSKVEALFRNVDEMKETLKELKPALFTKVERMFENAQDSLRLQIKNAVKAYLDKENSHARKSD